MTVGQLIDYLSSYNPDLRVLVDGYESGYDDLSMFTRRVADQGYEEPTVLGKYDDEPSDAAGFPALILSRHKF